MSKGNVTRSQAQAAYEDASKQAVMRSMNTWMPVQQYYARQLQDSAPGLQQMAMGQAAATGRAAGADAMAKGLALSSNSGAGAGSGRFLMGLQGGYGNTAGAAGLASANAASGAQQHWVRGLQDVIRMGQTDQASALGGMQSAAQAEQAYEQERADYFNSAIAGVRNFAANQLGGEDANFGAAGGGGGGGGGGMSMGNMAGMASSMMGMFGGGGGGG